MFRWSLRLGFVGLIMGLVGCAGTIERESKVGSQRIQGATYRSVEVVLADSARKLQADNMQFSVRELSEYVRRRLESTDLLDEQGALRVEVTIESFRVRSAAAAVLLGIMAGTDSIEGYVRVFDANNKQVHGFKVNASYGLGGWGGGQDSMRMNWLYDKFSELAVAELSGSTQAVNVKKGSGVRKASAPVVITPSGRTTSVSDQSRLSSAVAVEAPKKPLAVQPEWIPNAELRSKYPATDFAKLNDVASVPGVSNFCRDRYKVWLGWSNPKAFAVGPAGNCGYTQGTKPANPDLRIDPAERALVACTGLSKGDCKLYAIDDAIVWRP
jgi:hypothetical protein